MKRLLVASVVLAAIGCNQHPVEKSVASGAVEIIESSNVSGSTEIDILWVIDNSGSMCQEQEVLVKNFQLFIDEIEKTSIDFHIGVTTTQINDFALEPVAVPGQLQSTPQPIPGFDQTCIKAVDNQGQIIEGNFEPVVDAINLAVDCMETPDDALRTPSMLALQCATTRVQGECASLGCPEGSCGAIEQLFPPVDSYRQIPKVLKSSAYRDPGQPLDVDSLRADFACMSLVGTRGYGFEKGLGAAVLATSPDMTGGIEGSDGADDMAPNHGLIRKDARFALVFVTDENDCTHDGNVNESHTCQDAICEYASVDGSDSLIPVQQVKDSIMQNIRVTKGLAPDDESSFGDGQILVASINGDEQRFTGTPLDMCDQSTDTGVRASCRNELGVAFSGDRYLDFLRTFPETQQYPPPTDAVQGWLCQGDFSPALTAIGEFLAGVSTGCISRPVFPCSVDADCPSFPFSGTSGTCVDVPNTDGARRYCDSGIQVRVELNNPTAENFDTLTNSGFCIDGSIANDDFPNGCVIDPARYNFGQCPAGLEGIRLSWENETAAETALLGTNLQLRYNSAQSDNDSAQ